MKNFFKCLMVPRPEVIETEKIEHSASNEELIQLLESDNISMGSGQRIVTILLKRLVLRNKDKNEN